MKSFCNNIRRALHSSSTSKMAILLTGGTGKTSLRVARLCQDAHIPFLLASRRGASAAPAGMPAVKFDWLDSSTFSAPFAHRFPGGEKITAAYLMTPIVADPEKSMNAFIDYAAREHGVRRFVFVTGSSAEIGVYGPGKVWKHLIDSGAEYCVLRPTWFMENLSEEAQRHLIKDQSVIYTACGDGKIPFVSAADIAAVAFHALTVAKPPNCDYRVLGPELLTYDQVAEKLSHVIGRKITHVKITQEQMCQSLTSHGLPDFFAQFLAYIEAATANGAEERTNDVVERLAGRPPKTFDAFARENKEVWL